MYLQLFYLLIGLVLIIKGGDLFVGASVRIAELLRMPRIVIGSTLVSLATTTPELVVSIVSGLRGESGLAVGNAVGSCICNLGLILGFTAACRHIEVHFQALKRGLVAMVGSGLLLFVLTLDLTLARWQGLLLVVVGVAYFILDFRSHRRLVAPAVLKEANAIEKEQVAEVRWVHTPQGTAGIFLLGAVLVVLGSRLLVDAAVAIATGMGIPPMMIGLTVVALGTSLPELVTAITSARRQVSDLGVGNIIGANIANLTLIVGSAASLSEVTISRLGQVFNLTALLVGMGLMVWFVRTGRRISRREGAALLGFYSLYLAVLIGLAVAGK